MSHPRYPTRYMQIFQILGERKKGRKEGREGERERERERERESKPLPPASSRRLEALLVPSI